MVNTTTNITFFQSFYLKGTQRIKNALTNSYLKVGFLETQEKIHLQIKKNRINKIR
jgi:hypothetical protein